MSLDLEQIKKDLASGYYDQAGVEMCKNVIRLLVEELETKK